MPQLQIECSRANAQDQNTGVPRSSSRRNLRVPTEYFGEEICVQEFANVQRT